MDSIDKHILLALDGNCRLSYQALSDRLGITANAIRKRLDRLIETGVIEEFVVILRPEMVGSEYLVALVQTDASEDEEEFIEYLGAHLNVVQAGQIVTSSNRLYFVHCEYVGSEELKALSTFFRQLEPVTDADIEARIGFQREVQKEWNTSESQNETGLRLLAEAARLTVAKPALSRISVDRAGNLWTLNWALPNRPSPDQRYDVFRPDGVWLGSVNLSAGMRLAEAGDDYVLVIVEDEIGIRRVRLHELVKPDRPRQDS